MPENVHSFAYIQEKINHTVKYFKKIFACIIGVYDVIETKFPHI